GRTPGGARPRDHHDPPLAARSQADGIADAHDPRGLDPLPVDAHPSIFDGHLGERARLVEARRPEPLVDADLIAHARPASRRAAGRRWHRLDSYSGTSTLSGVSVSKVPLRQRWFEDYEAGEVIE